MGGLRVLITNVRLDEWTGTELYVRDVARALLARGHSPVAYSPRLGALAAEMRCETIPVVEDLSRLSVAPDIIHGHHANETLTALLHFPDAPAVYFCHDWYFKQDYPPAFPRVLRYVAVDAACREKLVSEHGVPAERVAVLTQFFDAEKFRPRSAPLPPRPRRALVLCNYTKESEHLAAAREACARARVELDVRGAGVGRPCERPEEILGDYDVVFAKGRAALEAAAVGAAVVVYWWRRLGPLVTPGELERLRQENFGVRVMGPQLTPEEFGREVGRALELYDPAGAAEVSRRVRETSGRDATMAQLLEIYEDAIAEHEAAPEPDRAAEARAAAAHLRRISLSFWEERSRVYNSTPFRLAERLLKTPLVGRLARPFARVAAGRPARRDG